MNRTGSRAARQTVLLVALSLGVSAVGTRTPAADQVVEHHPTSQGRALTPAGSFVPDRTTQMPAVGSLPVDFVRSPDSGGPDGRGRYLLVVNSGFGLQIQDDSRPEQSIAVVDLTARPEPAVIQNVPFPSPHSANVGVVFDPRARDGSYRLYVSGGFENRVWIFGFTPGALQPVSPAGPGTAPREAPSIDLTGFATQAPSPAFNGNRAPVYPTGLALAPDGETLFVANNLADNLGIVSGLSSERRFARVALGDEPAAYPYGVVALPASDGKRAAKVYVSCWGSGTVAVVDPARPERPATHVTVGRHPTAMRLNARGTRLYVVNSNADSVSVVDTATDREVERIGVGLAEGPLVGGSPEGLALSGDERTLYVANAHGNAVAVVALSAAARDEKTGEPRSAVRGFVPTGAYPSAVAVVGHTIFVGNGKGTGFENSSVVPNTSGRAPNAPNDRFPEQPPRRGGAYSVALVAGTISRLEEPGERDLAAYTEQVMRNNGMVGERKRSLFAGRSPIRHVIYVIKENRTYDQVFGDLERAGDGSAADGDARLAIFGAGDAARRPDGAAQNITPNHRALALRFGLFDRFFVNAEASPDGHNWSTAAFSNDYVDKAYRWDYSGRGRSYDYEGFNRLPDFEGSVALPTTGDALGDFLRRHIPYLNGGRDIGEPESLYLWDAAARAGLSYRVYGEFIGTVSEGDVAALNARRDKAYPDTTPNASAVATKRSLEGHFMPQYRNFDLQTPDAITTASYTAAKSDGADPLISGAGGNSRVGEWLEEFRAYAADVEAGRPDRLPNLSIVRLSNDHTAGLSTGLPTPQFYVADNDYALGRMVEAVSKSPYWKDTAIVVVEDDAQDGPDHVDAHRSVALVISAYNRPGALVHEYHTTVSLVRTIEMLLGLAPMNLLDASAAPIDVFQETPDLTPYTAVLPDVALDNLIVGRPRDAATALWVRRTGELDLDHADVADARTLNGAIWFSVRGGEAPEAARLPAYDALRAGIAAEREDEEREEELEIARPAAVPVWQARVHEPRERRRTGP